MTILDTIVAYKKSELARIKQDIPLEELKKQLYTTETPRSLKRKIMEDDRFLLICEIKKASPSKGIIQPEFDPVRLGKQYEKGGASAISVLTDAHFFMGHLDYIKRVKKVVDLPLLRKDFIFDPYQIYQSKVAGADLILLIARILEKQQLSEYLALSEELQLEVLLEVADENDINNLPELTENVILGINNRNLESFDVDFEKSFKLIQKLPAHLPVIGESGVRDVNDCLKLKKWGFRGALIGESLMKTINPEQKIKELLKGTNDDIQT
jgi:indole-3-glycerol phosphate synthase